MPDPLWAWVTLKGVGLGLIPTSSHNLLNACVSTGAHLRAFVYMLYLPKHMFSTRGAILV